ncbi:MAG: hypothetical protein HQ580_03855 [Planctomycetes bacterium]|nr:hypothetical protein [Planctomycetota bacterium]
MSQQARMLLRCILECVFPLVAISKETGYSQKIIGSEEHERLRTYKKLIRFLRRHNPNHPNIKRIQDDAKQAEENISEHGFEKLSIFHNAESAGLADWYDVIYGDLSTTILLV